MSDHVHVPDDLARALLAERFGQPVREHHNQSRQEPDTRALRLVWDEDEREAS